MQALIMPLKNTLRMRFWHFLCIFSSLYLSPIIDFFSFFQALKDRTTMASSLSCLNCFNYILYSFLLVQYRFKRLKTLFL